MDNSHKKSLEMDIIWRYLMDKIDPKNLEGLKILREWEEKNVPKTAIDEKFKKYLFNYFTITQLILIV